MSVSPTEAYCNRLMSSSQFVFVIQAGVMIAAGVLELQHGLLPVIEQLGEVRRRHSNPLGHMQPYLR